MNPEKVNQFLERLDERSRAIVLFMAKKGHAKIRPLSKLIAAESDSHTLMKIKEVINPAAEEILGEPALQFEDSKLDKSAGEKVLFSWHLNEKLEFLRSKETLDVFDEGRNLRIVAELPGVDRNELSFELTEDALIIFSNGGSKAIPLPEPAKKIVGNSYKNNVLEVKLEKVV